MKHRFFTYTFFLCFLILSAAFANADIVILKNGQVLRDVTIRAEGDTLYCENNEQSFYINPWKNQIIETRQDSKDEKNPIFHFWLDRLRIVLF